MRSDSRSSHCPASTRERFYSWERLPLLFVKSPYAEKLRCSAREYSLIYGTGYVYSPSGIPGLIEPFGRHHEPDSPPGSRLDPDDGLAFGFCDLGLGEPELGCVSPAELATVRGKLGLTVERDRHFIANKTISAYADEARTRGQITTQC